MLSIEVLIRPCLLGDLPSLETLYPAAFPEEDLLPLVRELAVNTMVSRSLVGSIDEAIVGHIVLTNCAIQGAAAKGALLGPLAVSPEFQKIGVGRTLIEAGIASMLGEGVDKVFVLGDPNYYHRLGFEPERKVKPPYELPDEWHDAWQSRRLSDGAQAVSGVLSVPEPWREKSLWLP